MKSRALFIAGASVLIFGMDSHDEIDVISRNAPQVAAPQKVERKFNAEGGKYEFTIGSEFRTQA